MSGLPFYEFFAGGGMARLGLEAAGFRCALANDNAPMKCAAYRANFGDADLIEGGVETLTAADAPGQAALAWASFPCQDLSLAGARAGLDGARSGAFWDFWRLIRALDAEGRGPRTIAIENVLGLASSRGGADLHALFRAFADSGRAFAALAVDAKLFLPQSRPRLFILAWDARAETPPELAADGPAQRWTPPGLARALAGLPPDIAARSRPLDPPPPEDAPASLTDLLEGAEAVDAAATPAWRSEREVAALLSMMSERQRARLESERREATASGRRRLGALYRRMRPDGQGGAAQRAEARFDIAGCLRTPAGGSSRQTLLALEPDGRVRARLMSAREAARLMGLGDDYRLPPRYNDAYKIAGDGVAAPVAEFVGRVLARTLALASARAGETMVADAKSPGFRTFPESVPTDTRCGESQRQARS